MSASISTLLEKVLTARCPLSKAVAGMPVAQRRLFLAQVEKQVLSDLRNGVPVSKEKSLNVLLEHVEQLRGHSKSSAV